MIYISAVSSFTFYSFIMKCFSKKLLQQSPIFTANNFIRWPCLIQNKEQFVDDSFPPTGRSLYYDGSKGKVVQWLRLKQVKLYNQQEDRLQWKVFSSPKPSDICQGVLGNCWYAIVVVSISSSSVVSSV